MRHASHLPWLLLAVGCQDYKVGSEVTPGEPTDASTTPTTQSGGGTPTTSDGPTSTTTDTAGGPGIAYGHFDVDTSSFIAEWDKGRTDGHVHEYDNVYDVVSVDCLAPLDSKLHGMPVDIPSDQPFVLIVGNPDLSPGGWLEFADHTIKVQDQAAIAISDLERYSLGGVAGTTKLDALSLTFDRRVILEGGLIGTQTGCVQKDNPGVYGSWRNGALTLQAVDPDTVTTDTSYSYGGVQGVATAGLLWEMTVFWHWDGPCSDDPAWSTWVPGTGP